MNIEYFNRIVNTYGIGVDEFLDLFAAQNHKCAICTHSLVLFSTDRDEQPVVDHNHRTGAVRGILCYECNLAVGWLEKNPLRTTRCISYIKGNRDRKDCVVKDDMPDLMKELSRRKRKNKGVAKIIRDTVEGKFARDNKTD